MRSVVSTLDTIGLIAVLGPLCSGSPGRRGVWTRFKGQKLRGFTVRRAA